LKNADTAMYGAKAGGRNTKERYAAVMNAGALHLLELEADLHSAVERDELIVHYQPQVDPRTMRIVATEALVRWLHPRRGLINPQDFIPLAEESGLIGAIDEWVLRHACAQAKAWEQAGFAPLRMAVNLSAHQFRRTGLVAVVGAVLAETGIDPDLLELELTETAAMQDPERVAQMLVELRELGVRLAIDDFGTGYSILGHLKRLPVGRLKIDRAFVAGLPHDRHDGAIVASTIRMAHEVGMEVTAEGVENEAQARFLTERGCDLLQGFLYAQPVPAEAFGEMLRVQEGSISSAAVRS
jgi:EAL domain-containing protein (putative c-di-GMP-specific phosphodiesterase class I)